MVRLLPKTRSSLMFLMQNQRPAGKVHTRMWRSKKKDTQVVGWCSDTDAIMGMWILAQLWITWKTRERRHHRKSMVKQRKRKSSYFSCQYSVMNILLVSFNPFFNSSFYSLIFQLDSLKSTPLTDRKAVRSYSKWDDYQVRLMSVISSILGPCQMHVHTCLCVCTRV